MDALEEMIQRIKQTHTKTNSTDCLEADDICPKCHNTGFEMFYGNDGLYYARECRCGIRKRQIMNNRLKFASIPEIFKDVTLDSFDATIYSTSENRNKAEIAVKCVDYWLKDFEAMKDRGMGLYLYSETKGSGKTRIAASIANELIYKNNCQVKFCTSLQILNEIKAVWDKQSDESETTLLGLLSASEILIIDDFGTEQSDKPWINERFYQIINNRYIDKKVTIFTSNERLDLLKYDERITNRIKERTYQVPFPEDSVRDLLAKNNMRELVREIKK